MTDRQTVKLPYGSTILSIAVQNGIACLWARVDARQPLVDREFLLIATGGQVEPSARYIGTFYFDEGRFVFHLFEV